MRARCGWRRSVGGWACRIMRRQCAVRDGSVRGEEPLRAEQHGEPAVFPMAGARATRIISEWLKGAEAEGLRGGREGQPR